MKTISKEYLLLFNALTDAEEALRKLREQLMEIQRQELTIEFVKLEETRQMIKSRHTSSFLSCTAFVAIFSSNL